MFTVLLCIISVNIAVAGTVTVVLNGTGKVTGTINSVPPESFECSNIPGDETSQCSVTGGFGKEVSLHAETLPTLAFLEWTDSSGNLAGSESTCIPTNKTLDCGTHTPLFGTRTVTARFGVPPVPPEVRINPVEPAIAPCGPPTATEACFTGEVNPMGTATKWQFEYHPVGTSTWSKSPEPEGDAGDGTSFVNVSATVAGLEPNTAYEVRLAAVSQDGSAPPTSSEPFSTRGASPDVLSKAAWSLSDTSVTLSGTVNPHNSGISECRFDLVAQAMFEAAGFSDAASRPCSPVQNVGNAPVEVEAQFSGLTPGTEYTWRLTATTVCAPGCEHGSGDSRSVTTYPVVVLPQRAYELASSEDTNGIGVKPYIASENGDRVAYVSVPPLPGSEDGSQSPLFIASRQSDGSWLQKYAAAPAPPPGEPVGQSGGEVFTPDLAKVAFTTGQPISPDDQNGANDAYLRDLSGGFTWLSTNPSNGNGVPTAAATEAAPAYLSRDGNEAIFTAEASLLPQQPAFASSFAALYEWRRQGTSESLHLVSVRPNSNDGFEEGGVHLGSQGVSSPGATSVGAVSQDGKRVAFSAKLAGSSRLFVRINGERTLEVGGIGARFAAADSNMNVIYFIQEGKLFSYSVATESSDELLPGVIMVYGCSEDGRRVYFTSTAQLDEAGELTESPAPGESVEGTPLSANLYMAELGDSAHVRSLSFIATVEDPVGTAQGPAQGPGRVQLAQGKGQFQAWREISTNQSGSFLAFRDSLDAVPGRTTGGTPQIFIYDAERHVLSCASCPSDGSAPTGIADLVASEGPNDTVIYNSYTNPVGQHSRNVTSDGAAFFETATPLTPDDRNQATDVYEYRAGHIQLVSAGSGSEDAFVGDASLDGSSVFFTSAVSLVPGAEAGVQHLYDARIGGGYQPATPQVPCSGGDCRGASGSVGAGRQPTSNVFQGPGNRARGNAHARKCPEGKHKVKGKGKAHCAKKRRRRHHRAHHGRHGAHAGRALRATHRPDGGTKP
jgi:hypothetical protein